MLFALAAIIFHQNEMADAINNLDFSKAADDPRAIRSIAIRNDRTGEILRPKERTETHTDIALRSGRVRKQLLRRKDSYRDRYLQWR